MASAIRNLTSILSGQSGLYSADTATVPAIAVGGFWYDATGRRWEGSAWSTTIYDVLPPIVTSAVVYSVAENTPLTISLTANKTVTWAKTGGADATALVLSGSTVTFAAKDFETPTDAGTDNVYHGTFTATDTAGNVTPFSLAVIVTDVVETVAPMIATVVVNDTTPTVGDTLSAAVTYSTAGDPAPTLSRSWKVGGTVAGTAATYAVVSADIGKTIVCDATASNSAGTSTVASAVTAAVVAAPVAPTAPVIATVGISDTTPTVGDVLTTAISYSTAGNPTPTVTYDWKVDGTTVATTSSYTVVSGNVGKAITCTATATNTGGSNTKTSAATSVVAAAIVAPANNMIAISGDSRNANSSAELPTAKRLNYIGPASWALAASGYKARLSPNGNRAVGGDTTAMMVARNADIVSDPAGTVIHQGGVNDGANTALTFTNTTQLFDEWTAAGKTIITGNELPDEGNQAAQITRRDWFEHPDRKLRWPKLIVVDTYRAVLKDGTTGMWKDGLTIEPSGSGKHPNALANMIIGKVFGDALAQVMASFPSYAIRSLPTESVRSPSNPSGPVLDNFAMAGSVAVTGSATVTGNLSTGYSVNNAGGGDIAVQCSTTVNSDGFNETVLRFVGTTSGTGTPSVVLSSEGANNTASILDRLLANDDVWAASRIKVDAGAIGFRGLGLTCRVSAGTPSYVDAWANEFGSSNVTIPVVAAIDKTLVSHIGKIRSDWATQTLRALQMQWQVSFAPSSPVDITVRISQPGMRGKAAA